MAHCRPAPRCSSSLRRDRARWYRFAIEDRGTAEEQRILSRPIWFGALTLIGLVEAAIFHLWHISKIDRIQQLTLVYSLAHGKVRYAMGFRPYSQTSPPGYGIVAPVMAVAEKVTTLENAYMIAALSCIPVFVVGWILATRAYGIPARSVREVGLLAVVMTSPPILATYLGWFHPADMLALGVCLIAFALIARGRIGWAAVTLGYAVCCRQWAVMVVAVVLVLLRGRDRLIVLVGSVVTFVVLVLPFYAASPDITAKAIKAPKVFRGGGTVGGIPYLTENEMTWLSRYVPLILAGVVCLWLLRRQARFTPEVAAGSFAVVLGFRPPIDPAGLAYYLAPVFAFTFLLVSRSWRRTGIVAALGFAVLALLRVRNRLFWHERWDDTAAGHINAVATSLLWSVPVVLAFVLLRRALAAMPPEPEPVDDEPDAPEDTGDEPALAGLS